MVVFATTPALRADEPKTSLQNDAKAFQGKTTKSGPPVSKWEEIVRLQGHKGTVRWMSCSPDSTRLATAEAAGHVNLWDVAKAKKIRSLGYETTWFVAYTQDGKQLVTAGPGRGHALQVRLWDPATGNPLAQYGAGGGSIASMALAPDGKLMVTGSWEGSVQALAFDGTSLKRVWSANLGFRVNTVAISPDTERIAVVGGGVSRLDRFRPGDHPIPDRLQWLDTLGELRILDAANGKALFSARNPVELNALRMDPYQVIATVVFSPDGKLLASSNGAYGTLRLQDAQTGKEVRTLKGHANTVASMAFSPDGKLLASCGTDDKVRIWNTATGEEHEVFSLAAPAALIFSPDNQSLAVSSGCLVCLWREREAKDAKATQDDHKSAPPMPGAKEPKKRGS
jgi:WD40 repeat protein